jgi:hypothetical protein
MYKRVICAGLALLAFSAQADSAIFRAGADSVEITEEPCHAAVVPLIPAEIVEHFRAANAVISGKLMQACWALRGDGYVHLYYADEDQGLVPVSQFKKTRQM